MKVFFYQFLVALAAGLLLSSCGVSNRAVENAASERVLDLVNRERTKRGLARVIPDDGLRELAMGHGQFLVRNVHPQRKKPTKSLAHAGFRERAIKARKQKYFVLSEVIMVGYAGDLNAVAERTVTGWLRSPDHRKAILQKDRRIMGIETRLPGDGRYFVVGLLSNGKVK